MSKNLIIEVLAPLGLSLITFVALWGKAILGQHKQRFVWRLGVAIGAAFSLFSSIGYLVPFQLYPITSYMFGMTFMTVCIVYAAYNQPISETITAEELQNLKDGKVSFLTQMAMGAGFVLLLMVLAGFTAGQQEGRIVNESVASAVNRLSIELVSFKKEVRNRFGVLEAKSDSSSKYDSLRMKQVTRGQMQILDQGKKKR